MTEKNIKDRLPERIMYSLHQKPPVLLWGLFSIQHLLAMFGATILVPYLTGLSPSVALVGSGIGTLIFIILTKAMVPAYLGSSFAFITPIIVAKASAGAPTALVGCALASLVFCIVAIIIRIYGVKWLIKILPPVVIAPVIMVIGLELAKVATGMAFTSDGKLSQPHVIVSLITLATIVLSSVYLKGILSLIPILIGVVAGYLASVFFGMVDFTLIVEAPWFRVPDFHFWTLQEFSSIDWSLALGILPVSFVVMSEHIGHQLILGRIVGVDYLKNPGLHRSMLGDGVASFLASMIGAPPSTTYGENMGVLALTKVFSVWVIGGTAVLAIVLGFIGKISAFISSIPVAVMGGVGILLFGVIASSGLRMMIEEKIDLSDKKNLMITSVVLIVGIGGGYINNVPGMALATLAGIVMAILLRPDRVEKNNLP